MTYRWGWVAAAIGAVVGIALPAVVRAGTARVPTTRINPKDGEVMVLIPAGAFTMGDPNPPADSDDAPARKVYLAGYWIYRDDVTVAQYRKFCTATGHKMPPAPTWGWKDDHPIVNVTWYDAEAYCQWAGVMLTNEAQWEKAARGTDARIYPWGNEWDPTRLQCSTDDKPVDGSAAVGRFPKGASPYGLNDMAGNVFQWCENWYDAGDGHVVRGGSWHYTQQIAFQTYRRAATGVKAADDLGFRCAMSDYR